MAARLLAVTAVLVLAVAGAHAVAARQHYADAQPHLAPMGALASLLAHDDPPAKAKPKPKPKARPDASAKVTSTPAAIVQPAQPTMSEHAAEAATEQRIGHLLTGSAAVGLALAAALPILYRRRLPLIPWAAMVIAAHVSFLAAGLASRSSWGLLGHTDDASILWATTMAGELAVCLLAAVGLGVLVSVRYREVVSIRPPARERAVAH